jgi:hypothetical protein
MFTDNCISIKYSDYFNIFSCTEGIDVFKQFWDETPTKLLKFMDKKFSIFFVWNFHNNLAAESLGLLYWLIQIETQIQ